MMAKFDEPRTVPTGRIRWALRDGRRILEQLWWTGPLAAAMEIHLHFDEPGGEARYAASGTLEWRPVPEVDR
jgi:hypothetical protein